MLIRLLIYIPLVAFLAVLQSAIVRLFPAVNYQPDLLTVLIVFLAHREGRVVGQSVGFLGGILEDSIGLAPFGFHTLVRTALGYIMGFNREWRVEESPIAALFTCSYRVCGANSTLHALGHRRLLFCQYHQHPQYPIYTRRSAHRIGYPHLFRAL